jgi:hypothetical protein
MNGAWTVSGGSIPFDMAPLYALARQRVLASRRLAKYQDIILSDGYASDEEHLRWVASCKVGEIEAWADQIRRDSDA